MIFIITNNAQADEGSVREEFQTIDSWQEETTLAAYLPSHDQCNLLFGEKYLIDNVEYQDEQIISVVLNFLLTIYIGLINGSLIKETITLFVNERE